MNLRNKKELAARTLGVGKNRIILHNEAISEIKEAITKQDIKTMFEEGLISLKPVKGRKTNVKRKTKRGPGKVKKKINKRKQNYVKITRKLRRYVRDLRNSGKIDRDSYIDLRKKIKMSEFRSKVHLKEYLEGPTRIKQKEEDIEIKLDKSRLKEKPNKVRKTKTGVKDA
ncbi:50S ribosomal protein L19e [Candidatus Pacearchaeota archaeon]|nr:50S ribosomal protein L19e [Candidatus Pacearchaeota archaeon]